MTPERKSEWLGLRWQVRGRGEEEGERWMSPGGRETPGLRADSSPAQVKSRLAATAPAVRMRQTAVLSSLMVSQGEELQCSRLRLQTS